MVGYRRVPATDSVEQQLRDDYYAAMKAYAESGRSQGTPEHRDLVRADKALTDYLWQRTLAVVEADRAKHPKAKRNQPVPEGVKGTGGRYLP